MNVYVGKLKNGRYVASLKKNDLKRCELIISHDIPVNHGKVYILEIYKGFDYNYDSGSCISDVKQVTVPFHSVMSLKKNCTEWSQLLDMANANPDKYIVTDFSIASVDHVDSNGNKVPFTYGDVFEGKFNAKIIGVKVNTSEGMNLEVAESNIRRYNKMHHVTLDSNYSLSEQKCPNCNGYMYREVMKDKDGEIIADFCHCFDCGEEYDNN